MICYNEHDKHLTKINLNKFALWICPLFKENSDLPWKLKKEKRKKKDLVCKKNHICICVKGKKQDFIKKNQSCFV